jgi:hypothetical protein
MKDAIKNGLIALAAIAVIAIVTWLTGGADKVVGWLHSPEIEVRSVSRGEVSTFLAGEQIRFSLKGVSPDRVLWDFEETEIQPGSVQIEHAFAFDSNTPAGIESTRRVDVFYREGAEYRTAWTHVGISNLRFVSARIEGKGIALKVDQPANTNWVLSEVSLGKFEDGHFKAETKIPAEQVTYRSPLVVTQDQLGKMGMFDADRPKGVNAYFEFVSPDGKSRLKTVEDLDPQIKQLRLAATDKHAPPA